MARNTKQNGSITITREQAKATYMAVVNNWAVYASDISGDLGLSAKDTTAVLRELEARGLAHAHHVNGEKRITWQTDFDVENEKAVPMRAGRAFAKAWPKDEETTAKATANTGSTTDRPRYTEDQLAKARAAKAKGLTRKQVAEAAGIRSPNYLAKLLKREQEAKAARKAKRNSTRSAKAATKATRKPRTKAAA
jgi:hypothetical protein